MNRKKAVQAQVLKKIARQLFIQMGITMALYLVISTAIFFLAYFLYSRFIWYGDEILYKIIHFFKLRLDICILAYIVIGLCSILQYYWKKPYLFLSEILDATEKIYEQDDTLIVLPPPLKHVESQMNQLKISVLSSERAAREAEKRKNDLVAYLAHDLKTPITSVIGYLSLLRDEQQISEDLRERYLSIALDKAERLDELINEFFEITRFNLSHITLEYSQINLTRLLEQLIFEFQPMLSEKNLECCLTASPDIRLHCDANKLQRVFDNLLRNAVNYSFEDSQIQITVALIEDQVRLSFENSGNTISEEKLNRIFEQFYRLDTARSSKGGGAGLGLAIAKEIVELHQGKLYAFSENEIIRFVVTLPSSLESLKMQ